MTRIPIPRALAAAVALLVSATVAVPAAASPGTARERRPSATEFVFASGLDHGPLTGSSPGMHQTDGPGTELTWQRGVARTGTGAYHAVGGDLQGDETIGNRASTPFGGLEVWVGGAFRFTSFPDHDGIWLMVAAPTDGVQGADDKPVVSIDARGRLRLSGSNSSSSFAESSRPLARHRWYDLVLHGRNGASQTQQLFVYNGRTDRLIERLDLVMDVTGGFRNQLTKWGFGTSQDSSGLEYYLDDIFHARGGDNPGPVRVEPRVARSDRGGDFDAVGATTASGAVDDGAPDEDATYIASEGAGAHRAVFALTAPSTSRGDLVYLVQATAIVRSASSQPLTAEVGVRIGGQTFASPLSVVPGYTPRVVTWTENPSADRAWRARDRFSGIVLDDDQLGDELRVTAVWWDVVYAATSG